MNITKLAVTDEDGNEHVYEGSGFIHPVSSQSFKSENYTASVTAHLVLPSKGKVNA